MQYLRTTAVSAVTAVVFTLLAQAGLAAATAGSRTTRIETKELRIVDDSGKTRAVLGVLEGKPMLHLYSVEGKPQFSVVLEGASSLLSVNDQDLKAAVTLVVDQQGARVGVDDSSGFVAVNLSSNHPGITIRNKETKVVTKVPAQ